MVTRLDSVGALFSSVMAEAAALVGAERATLFLVDEAKHELYSKVAGGYHGDGGEGHDGREIRMRVGAGLAGHAARACAPVRVADARRDPRFNAAVDRASGFTTRAVVCVPVVSAGTGAVGGVVVAKVEVSLIDLRKCC